MLSILPQVLHSLRTVMDERQMPGLRVVHFKNRFTVGPSPNWKDVMIHVIFVDEEDVPPEQRFMSEVQLSLKKMAMTRKNLGGHDAYSTFRSAKELQNFVETSYLG